MKISQCLVAGLLAAAACSGKTGNITLTIAVSPNDDPFAGATEAKITVGSSVTMVPVTAGGHFTYSLSRSPINTATAITIEALDASGAVVGFGQTPPVTLPAQDESPIAVWVGKPGKVQPAATALPTARAEMASFSLGTGGIIYAGGRACPAGTGGTACIAAATPLTDALTYSIATQTILTLAPMNVARAGAVAGPIVTGGVLEGVVFGGASSAGFGSTANPNTNSEAFDLIGGDSGLWTPLTNTAIAESSYASIAILPDGDLVAAGGFDANKNPVASAQTVAATTSTLAAAALNPMTATRQGHAMVGATFADGAAAFVYGGLPDGSTAAVAERYISGAFTPVDLPNVENRRYATATRTAAGDILILGGTSDAGTQSSGYALSLKNPIVITPLPNVLSVPREHHTTNVVGTEILVCGGDNAGTVIASCDVLDATTYKYVRTEMMTIGRTYHSAEVAATGILVIAGGLQADGTPTTSIEIYNPSFTAAATTTTALTE